MRSPKEMDIIQIDSNVACAKACSNCTRLVAHQSKRWEMSPEQVRAAMKSLEGWYKPGKIRGLIGGEVTLHSQFEQIARVMQEVAGTPSLDIGVSPINDFDAFAKERLFDRSNGLGLWTSFGAGFYRHMQVVLEVFSHWNPNAHDLPGLHQANLIHRKDYIAATGITDDQWEEARDHCWLQEGWSATITPTGAFFCEQAAAIDMLLYEGKHGWPIESGWWQRTPADFKDQLFLCDHCSLAQRGPASVDQDELDIISPTNRIALEMAGSPVVKKGKFETWDGSCSRSVDTKDSYVADSGIRVSPLNESVRPKKVSLVVVCVDRWAHLNRTIHHNAALVDEVIVVTNREAAPDTDDDIGENVTMIWADPHEGDFSFNKGRLLNAGLAAITNPDWIILADADVFLNHNFARATKSHSFNPGVLYGAPRFDVQEDHHIDAFLEQGAWFPGLVQKDKVIDGGINGFMQMFNRRAHAIRDRWPNVMCEEFCSAGGVDSWFTSQFPESKRCMIPELAVTHISHGELGAGWNGTNSLISGKWSQVAMINHAGQIIVLREIERSPDLPLRLVSTKTGKVVETTVGKLDSVVKATPGGLLLDGEEQGDCHIHVGAKL